MLIVSTYVAPSSIHGLGLFATDLISKDTLIFRLDPNFDRSYTREEHDSLPEAAQSYIRIYGYYCPVNNQYEIEMDNGRYSNHSFTPNTYFSPCLQFWYAREDIQAGQEITSDYRAFDARWEDYAQYYTGEVLQNITQGIIQ